MTIINQNGINFELNKNNFTSKVVKSPSVSNSVFIPRSVFYESEEYIVVKIEDNAFEGNQLISSLLFVDNSEVQMIGKNAFKTSTIKYLSIPSSLKFFEEGWCSYGQKIIKITVSPQNQYVRLINDQILVLANDENDEKEIIFALRHVDKVLIPSYVTKIASHSFESCKNLNSLLFSDDSKLRSIGQSSFEYSNITKISFPPSLEFLEEGWCNYMSNLEDIEISPKNENFKFIDDKFLIGKGKEENESVLLFVKRNIVDCVVPSCVTRIGQFSFGFCSKLNSISFEENSQLKFISDFAFYNSKLSSLLIPSSLEQMDEKWCVNANSLKTILVSPKNKNFFMFNDSFLIFNEKVLLFARRDIQKVSFPSFITHIGNSAFSNCDKLESVLFEKDSSLVEIGEDAFNCCISLSKISSFPSSLKKICSSAFQYCEMIDSINFDLYSSDGKEANLEIIDECAFDSCQNLTNVSTIPKSVKKIGVCALGGNLDLKSISFQEGSKVEYIGKCAFSYTSISNIPIPSCVQGLEEDFSLSHNKPLYFDIWPDNKYNEFIDQKYLISKFQDETILNYANPNFEYALIPSKITRIGKEAFNACKSLKSVSFEKNSRIKSIGERAFIYSNLNSLELPESLEILEDDWCFVVRHLNEIKISHNNKNFSLIDNKFLIRKNVSNQYFEGDDLLFAYRDIETIDIPPTIARIKNNALSYCLKLKSISFIDAENSVLKEIGRYSFSECNNLKSIISIPSSLISVEDFAFLKCEILKSCEFLSNDLTINYGSFMECNSLTLLVFPNAKKITFGFNLFFLIKNEIVIFIANNAEIQQNIM